MRTYFLGLDITVSPLLGGRRRLIRETTFPSGCGNAGDLVGKLMGLGELLCDVYPAIVLLPPRESTTTRWFTAVPTLVL